MKTKVIILIALTAIATLSFTFAKVKKGESKETQATHTPSNEPVGGFASEDKI